MPKYCMGAFLSSTASGPVPESTQPPIQRVSCLELSGRGAYYTHLVLRLRKVEIWDHSLIRFHGVMLN
jgi:hypothetical protein